MSVPTLARFGSATRFSREPRPSPRKLTGLPLEKVTVHNHLIGGGFGRRLEVDGIAKAVRIAQKVSGPVKVIWTREEDIQQALYRPFYFDRFAASLSDGKIAAWSHRIAGSSILARWAPAAFEDGIDADAVDGAIGFPYDTPNVHVEYVHEEPPAVPTCFWRSVGPGHNIFVIESFVDELAHTAGQDPVAFRRAQLTGSPRLRACLDLAAEKSGWGSGLPPRVGRGVAAQSVFGSYLAAVAEVEVDASGGVAVRRVWPPSTAASPSIPTVWRRRSRAASSSACRRRYTAR